MNYVVVPEGLSLYPRNSPEPSFVFKQVIDYLSNIIETDDTIYFAPANNFGSNTSEQIAGKLYLEKNISPDTKIKIKTTKAYSADYIDTLGSAILLIQHYPEARFLSIELVCTKLHSKRASYCFRSVGFKINNIHKVDYKITNEPIVRRLWYYRYTIIHLVYEMVAYIKDKTTLNYRLKRIL